MTSSLEKYAALTPEIRAKLAKSSQAHKFDHGHVLVFSGGPGKGGAARLAARAALRIGAGVVTLVCPEQALAENAARLDAVMLSPFSRNTEIAAKLADPRVTAICIGPGFGITPQNQELLGLCLQSGKPAVLDADALTLISRSPAHFAMLHSQCILTPHGGEFARLFPGITVKMGHKESISKTQAAILGAERAGCTLLFKGSETIIAAPSGDPIRVGNIGDHSTAWLATAGSGDVLAGMIGGLLARGFSTLEASQTAAAMHMMAARSHGPGLIAEDLADLLPKVFREIGI